MIGRDWGVGKTKPQVVGTGLIALDIVMSWRDPRPRWWAGGTCGNVLALLGFLGWDAFPIARLRPERAGLFVKADLERCGVHGDYLHLEPQRETPVIFQRIKPDSSGAPFHTFSWICPKCGARMPRYSPVPQSTMKELLSRLGTPQVFFMDRASQGALIAAEACARQGALIVFEPSSVTEPQLFRRALALSHILKYSHDRMRVASDALDFLKEEEVPLLEIETLGRGGLRFRTRLKEALTTGWELMSGFPVKSVRDTAGSGDWCTAGLLHCLGIQGLRGFLEADRFALREALVFGQALAAWNCRFEGARGGMEKVSSTQIVAIAQTIIAQSGISDPEPESSTLSGNEPLGGICGGCAGRMSIVTR
jgi:sugar/nucleoside kinase (ribokinase family)